MMNIEPFALERYFTCHEFSAHYPLASADLEGMSLEGLPELADA